MTDTEVVEEEQAAEVSPFTAYGYNPANVNTHFYPQELPVMPVARYMVNAPQDGVGFNHSISGTATQPTGVLLSPVPFPDAPDTAPPANANRTDAAINMANNAGLGTAGGIIPRLNVEKTLITNQLAKVTSLLPASTATLTTVAPATGPTAGGTPLTLTGTGFNTNPALGATTVTVAGRAALSVVVVSATSITCVAPAGECPGQVGVSVSGPTGNAYKATSYTYT